jgi:hypothetical protein
MVPNLLYYLPYIMFSTGYLQARANKPELSRRSKHAAFGSSSDIACTAIQTPVVRLMSQRRAVEDASNESNERLSG